MYTVHENPSKHKAISRIQWGLKRINEFLTVKQLDISRTDTFLSYFNYHMEASIRIQGAHIF